ncbi:MAG: hypothetical protein ABGX16_24150 [Pirellulales bacterium]
MTLKQQTWKPLSLALILTVGLALMWGMLAGWGLSVLETEDHRLKAEGSPTVG